jgi:fluoride ion exporter CrcB/FEX
MTLGDVLTTKHVLLLAVGGSAGTIARYAVSEWFKLRDWVLGFVALLCQFYNRPGWLLLLGTGFCGGFTTFSTFSVEALALLEKGRPWAAAGYAFGSVVAGILGAWVGVKLASGR